MNITLIINSQDDLDFLREDLSGRADNHRDEGEHKLSDYAFAAMNALPNDFQKEVALDLTEDQIEQLEYSLENCADLGVSISVKAPTLRSQTLDRWHDLEDEILDMTTGDNCGFDCMRVISAADALLDVLTDCSVAERDAVVAAAMHQARVYYFG